MPKNRQYSWLLFFLPWHTINSDNKMKVRRISVLRFTLLLQKDRFFIKEILHKIDRFFMKDFHERILFYVWMDTIISLVSFTLSFKKTLFQFDVLSTGHICKDLRFVCRNSDWAFSPVIMHLHISLMNVAFCSGSGCILMMKIPLIKELIQDYCQ